MHLPYRLGTRLETRLGAGRGANDLSTGSGKALRRRAYLGISQAMHEDRIDSALGRIEAAMARIDAACEAARAQAGQPAGGSARVVELVNAYEKLREQVSESLRELDNLIGQLEA